MAVIVRDTFNRSNSTSLGNADTGQSWNLLPLLPSGSVFGTNGSQAYIATTRGATDAVIIDSGISDGIITVDTPAKIPQTRVFFRAQDFNNTFVISLDATQVLVYRWLSTGNTTLVTLGTYNASTVYHVKVVMNGSSIQIFFNNNTTADISFTDTNLKTITTHGIGGYNTANVTFDNFTVMDLNTIVYDGFDRANNGSSLGNADTGQLWSYLNSTWGISNSQAYNPSTSGPSDSQDKSLAYFDVGVSDVDISVTFSSYASAGYQGNLVIRANTTNYSYIYLQWANTSEIDLATFDGNATWTNIATYTGATRGTSDKVRIVAQGSSITVYLNGTQIMTATCTLNQSSTIHGLNGQGNSGVTFDNFHIDKIAVTPSTPVVTIVSVDHYKISNKSGINQSDLVFMFDTNVTNWTVNIIGTSPSGGTVVASGGAVSGNTNISVVIPYNDMYQEGNNQVNIYGENSSGWTPYMQN